MSDHKSSTSIARFLQDELHYPASAEIDRLDQLAGERIGQTVFFRDVAQARAAIEPWMPPYFLPVAHASFRVGLHLRPSDVRAQRIAFCAAEAPGEFIEDALSVEQLVYRALLMDEGYGNRGAMPETFAPSVAMANKLFGAEFYRPGKHGKFFLGDQYRLMFEVYGGPPDAIYMEARMTEAPGPRLALWEQGVKLATDSLAMYAGAALAHLELGARRQAAECAARSLACFHHTAYQIDLDQYMTHVIALMREFPELFNEDVAWQLQNYDPRLWAKRIGVLYDAGQFERADKLLNDVCHGTGGYGSVVDAFRMNYEALGWDWAIALCNLRA